MSGRSKTANTPTRYAGLQVQTSLLGTIIPVGWGTFRCKSNVVWYSNFKSKAVKSAAAGKGGATTSSYTYTADVIIGLCEGPINAITTVWKDTTALTTLKAAGLSVSLGAIGQPVWGYLASGDPSQAIGYSGLVIAYASNYALDSTATLPDHSFEVQTFTLVSGLKDANPADILTDWFTNDRYGVPNWDPACLADWTSYRTYCLAANLLLSPVIDSQRQASDFLHEILQASNSDCVWSEGLLKIIPYGDTAVSANGASWTPNLVPVYSLDDDSYVVKDASDDPVSVDLEDQSDAYNIVQIDYLSRSNAYNSGLQTAQDLANIVQYGRRKQDPTSLHSICDDTVAQTVAQLVLQRTLYIRGQYKFELAWSYDLLEPMDIVEITDSVLGLTAYPVRIVQIDEDEDAMLTVTAEDLLVGVSHAPLYANQDTAGFVVDRQIDPGGVEANLLLWSEDQTQSVWTAADLAVTRGGADPYGGTNACALVAATASGVHGLTQAFTAFSGLAYTFAVFVAPNGFKAVRVKLASTTSAALALVDVDVSAGAVITPATASGGATNAVATVTAAAGGFWRVSISAVLAADTALVASLEVLGAGGAETYAGDGASGLSVWGAQLKQGVDVPVYAATQGAIAGPLLFNPPSVLNPGGAAAWAAAAGGADWGGCNVWTSLDNAEYQQAGTINAPARYGAALNALPAAADPDTADTLDIDLGASAGALTAASDAQADASATLCLIDGELIAFSAASLTNPSRYALGGYIRRGILGTPIAAHAAGAPFVRLDSAVFQLPYLATQQGRAVYVKFQSFNVWGAATQDLADCNAYTITPALTGATAPGASAWTAVGATLSNNGVAIPALQISGASDNPSASGVIFYYRASGSGAWISAGLHSNATTLYDITSVASGGYYDVGVAYLVNGVDGAIQTIATAIQAGAASSGGAAGTVLLDSSVSGAASFAVPSGYPGAHVLIEIWGADGGCMVWTGSPPTRVLEAGGSGGYGSLVQAVTAGATTISFTIGAAGASGGFNGSGGAPAFGGGDTTVTSPAMTAHGGGAATTSTPGAGGPAGTGGSTNTAGAAGAGQTPTPANGRIRITAQA